MSTHSLLDERARRLLQQPLIVRISTITPDGYPHTVPVWFTLDGDEIIVFSERDTQKVRNVQRNRKGSIAIGGDPVGSPCYLIEGEFTVQEDAGKVWTRQITYQYEPAEQAEAWLASWAELDFVLLRLRPMRVIKVS